MRPIQRATDSGFRLEGGSSAPHLDKGLLLVISRALGVKELSADLLRRFPDRIGTPALRRFGMAVGQVYTADQVKLIGRELTTAGAQCPLVEKLTRLHQMNRLAAQAAIARRLSEMVGEQSAFDRNPVAGPPRQPGTCGLSEILNWKQIEEETLPKLIMQLCANSGCDPEAIRPWWFPSLVESLRDYMAQWLEARRASLVRTELSRRIFEALDSTLRSGGMTILDAPPYNIGQSFATRTWCELNARRARFVDVPVSTEDTAFWRAIAESIGPPPALSLKGAALRDRVERAMQSSKIMLVLDHAHYLWPQSNRREALPIRVNWLLGALVARDVPVALLTGPQFALDKQVVEQRTGWSSAEFYNLVGDYQSLPQHLSLSELTAIAEHCLPEADNDSIEQLALYALSSRTHVTAIAKAVNRARSLAGKAGRDKVTSADVEEAITCFVVPSDVALQKAFRPPGTGKRKRESTPAPAAQVLRTEGTSTGPARSFARGGRPLDDTTTEALSATLK